MKLNFELNMMVFYCDRVIHPHLQVKKKGNMTLKQDLINLRPH